MSNYTTNDETLVILDQQRSEPKQQSTIDFSRRTPIVKMRRDISKFDTSIMSDVNDLRKNYTSFTSNHTLTKMDIPYSLKLKKHSYSKEQKLNGLMN